MAVGGFTRTGARLHASDQSAVTDLFDLLGERIVGYCFRRTLDPRAAIEATDLTFLDAWSLRDRAPFTDRALEAWLYGLATRRCPDLPPADRRPGDPSGTPDDERALGQWWEWLGTRTPAERDAFILSEWEGLSVGQVAAATHASRRHAASLVASALSGVPADLPPVPPDRPVPPDAADTLLRWLMETPDTVDAVRRGPLPVLAVTVLLLVGLLVGGRILSQAPPPPPPSPSTSTDPTLVQRCRALAGFDPSLVRMQETGEPARLLLFFNLSGQTQLCGSFGGRVELSSEAQPDASGGSLSRLVMNSPDQVAILVGGALPRGTLRATVLGSSDSTAGWSHPVWWMSMVLPVADLAKQPPTQFILFDGGATSQTWLVPWVGTQVDESHLAWPDAAGLCGEALHSDQPLSGLRLLIPGPDGPWARGFLVVNQNGLLSTCAVGSAAGWIANPVEPTASGSAGIAVSTPQVMDPAQTLIVGGRVPPGVTSVSIDLPGGPYAATVERGYWVWSRTIDNRLLAVQPQLLTVRMGGSSPRVLQVDWLRSYAGITLRTWAPLAGTVLQSRCGMKSAPKVASLGGHVDVFGPESGTTTRPTLCFGIDTDMHRVEPLGFTGSLALHALVEPGADGSRLFAAGGALPAGVGDIVVHTPQGPIAATTDRGYWVVEWVAPGYPRGSLPATVEVTWTQNGRPMSRAVNVPAS